VFTDLVSLLEMFEEATNSLQADTVTSSVVIPAVLGVDSMLAACDTHNTFNLQLRSALQRRFSDILCQPEYVIAAMLDPRFKLLPFEQSRQIRQSAELTPVKTVTAIDTRSMLIQQLQCNGRQTAELSISTSSDGEVQVVTEDNVPKKKHFCSIHIKISNKCS